MSECSKPNNEQSDNDNSATFYPSENSFDEETKALQDKYLKRFF